MYHNNEKLKILSVLILCISLKLDSEKLGRRFIYYKILQNKSIEKHMTAPQMTMKLCMYITMDL